jgi:C4-dicarboxylate transporter, DctM subunit
MISPLSPLTRQRKPLTRAVWFGVFVVALLFAIKGWAAPMDADMAEELESADAAAGASGGLLLVAALAAMIVLGSPLFVIIGVLAAMCFLIYGDGYSPRTCLVLSPDSICGFDTFPAKITNLTTKNVLLAIPFFVVSGAIMSAGDIANRLVAFARALTGFLPGGLAIATVGGCVFFAAISGSSPVTVIAIGSTMYPALVKAGYEDRFSLGLVTTAGSLGILIPPSIPMLVFAIVAGGRTPLDVGELFLAGILPGLMIAGILALYSVYIAKKAGDRTERTRFSWGDVARSFREGIWAIGLPALILGGIYSGLFTPTEAAAVSVIYALVVELAIHRRLVWADVPKILSESAVMMGTLLIIMALAFGLNDFLVEEKVPDMAVAWIRSMDLTPMQFLLIVNVLLLIVGALMDSISAIMIIAPLLKPVSDELGIDPIHLGIIFIVNLEIGYLTPPIGINLFVASAVFEKKLGDVIRSVVPYILLMLIGLATVTYVPTLALGPVNVFLRGEPFWEPWPEDPREVAARGGGAAANNAKPGETGKSGRKILSIEEMTEIIGQMSSLCDAAETVLDDAPPPAQMLAKFRAEVQSEEVTHAEVLALLQPLETSTGDAAYQAFLVNARELSAKADWQCEPLAELLRAAEQAGPAPAGALPPPPAPDEDEDEEPLEDEDEDEDEEESEGEPKPMLGPAPSLKPKPAPPGKADDSD